LNVFESLLIASLDRITKELEIMNKKLREKPLTDKEIMEGLAKDD